MIPGSVLVAVACSSTGASDLAEQGPDGGVQAPTREAPTDDSCLGKEGLAFDDQDCNDCMSQEGCCQKTIACFKGNDECAALQECMVRCEQSGGTGQDGGADAGDGGDGGDGGGGGTGGGNGDGTGGGNGDGTGGGNGGGGGGGADGGAAKAACQEACKTQHAGAVTTWQDYNACVTGTCATSCL